MTVQTLSSGASRAAMPVLLALSATHLLNDMISR